MLFNSQVFIVGFLPIVVSLYYLFAAHRTARQVVVVLASLIFYGWWDVRFVPLLVLLTLANWLIAGWFGMTRARWIPLAGVALNLTALGVFKYADFFGGSVAALLGDRFQPWHLILPLGISFFVFQKISYLIDLRRGDRHIYSFLDFCMFVTFFPQLIAGPMFATTRLFTSSASIPSPRDMGKSIARLRSIHHRCRQEGRSGRHHGNARRSTVQ